MKVLARFFLYKVCCRSFKVRIPIKYLKEDLFKDGVGFDGSSVRGFQSIENSDMTMVPDVTTGYIDPFYSEKTIAFYCNVVNPITYESYPKEPN